jgi:hypothetical protein
LILALLLVPANLQAVAASMAFGPSDSVNLAVSDALTAGGDFGSFFGSALATAAANLVAAVRDAAAAVPAAFAEAMANAAAQGFSLSAAQTLAAALTASPQLAKPLSDAIAAVEDAGGSSEVLATEWAQATAAAITRGAQSAAAYAVFTSLTATRPFAKAYASALADTGPSPGLCEVVQDAKVSNFRWNWSELGCAGLLRG